MSNIRAYLTIDKDTRVYRCLMAEGNAIVEVDALTLYCHDPDRLAEFITELTTARDELLKLRAKPVPAVSVVEPDRVAS